MLRRLDLLLATLVLAAMAIGVVSLRREPERLAGAVRVIDGDTLDIDGRRVRLAGLDAPELAQTCHRAGQAYGCGETARDALIQLTGGELVCRLAGHDRYRRALGTCEVEGQDVGRALVLRGLAVAYRRYDAEERAARQRGAGLWAGRFDQPSEWRKTHGRDRPLP